MTHERGGDSPPRPKAQRARGLNAVAAQCKPGKNILTPSLRLCASGRRTPSLCCARRSTRSRSAARRGAPSKPCSTSRCCARSAKKDWPSTMVASGAISIHTATRTFAHSLFSLFFMSSRLSSSQDGRTGRGEHPDPLKAGLSHPAQTKLRRGAAGLPRGKEARCTRHLHTRLSAETTLFAPVPPPSRRKRRPAGDGACDRSGGGTGSADGPYRPQPEGGCRGCRGCRAR